MYICIRVCVANYCLLINVRSDYCTVDFIGEGNILVNWQIWKFRQTEVQLNFRCCKPVTTVT